MAIVAQFERRARAEGGALFVARSPLVDGFRSLAEWPIRSQL